MSIEDKMNVDERRKYLFQQEFPIDIKLSRSCCLQAESRQAINIEQGW
jgi:hypothetical protein